MKYLFKVLNISSASVIVLCFSLGSQAHASTIDKSLIKAEAACKKAIEVNTREAMLKFRIKYGSTQTSCSLRAFKSKTLGSGGGSSFVTSAVEASSGDGGDVGPGGGVTTRGAHPIIELMRSVDSHPTANITLDQMQDKLDASE